MPRLLTLVPLILILNARTAACQSRLRVGAGAAVGLGPAVGATRLSYAGTRVGQAELTIRHAGGPLAIRLEAAYLRINGRRESSVAFPAANVVAFTAGVMYRVGPGRHPIGSYVLGGAGPYNVQDALAFAAYRTRLGIHAGAGAAISVGRAQVFVELRLIQITTRPSTQLLPILAGARWFP